MATSRRALFRSPPVVRPSVGHDTLDEQHNEERTKSPDKDAGRPDDTAARGPKLTADRWRRIALAAYLRAERRGFAGDAELEDWLAAEKEVDEQLAAMDSSQGVIDDGK
jgi:Protein of unknown function (DUF2934)